MTVPDDVREALVAAQHRFAHPARPHTPGRVCACAAEVDHFLSHLDQITQIPENELTSEEETGWYQCRVAMGFEEPQ